MRIDVLSTMVVLLLRCVYSVKNVLTKKVLYNQAR